MKTLRKQPLLFTAALSIILVAAIVTLRAQKQNGGVPNKIADVGSRLPVADFNTPDDLDVNKREKRQQKGKKYDKALMEVNEIADTITSSSHWGLVSALPVDKSVAIIIGQITDRAAYLSADKTGVYSEYTVSIDEVLKNSSQISLAVGDSVAVERNGGIVRFPSGHLTVVSIPSQGVPLLGKRYVLFLTQDFPPRENQEPDLYILTGYELNAGKVFPLDYTGGDHPVTTYKGADESSFLNDLRAAIQQPK